MTEPRRPRILIITRNLPPLVGGMERLNWHMAEELSKTAEVHVVAPEGSAALAPAGVALREAPLKPLWKFLLRADRLARREARVRQPDIVLAGSGLAAPIALRSAHGCGAKSAVYVHGLDLAVRHPAYRAIWLPAIRRMDRVIANSHATADLCRTIGVAEERIAVVHPGVDLPSDTDAGATGARARIRQQYGLGTGPVLLSVGRLSTRKGLREFVTQSLPQIVRAQADTVLAIVGDAPIQALHAKAQTPASIQAAADAAGVGDHLRFLGVITDYIELGKIYRASDVHVFPVRSIPGDPEGFGMVAVEAAAHGLPTVAFAAGGVADAVAEGLSGHLIAPGDYPAFADAILRTLEKHEVMRTNCAIFAEHFAWSEFGAQITAELSELRTPPGRISSVHHPDK